MVEFSLATAIFLATLFGIVDFGRAFYAYDMVTNAAREATRYAIVRGTTCTDGGCATQASITAYVESKFPGLRPTYLTVTPNWLPGPYCTDPGLHGPGCLIQIQVKYTYYFVYRFPPATMTSTSQLVISQ
jgi:Flp pilus assembly protein TadG